MFTLDNLIYVGIGSYISFALLKRLFKRKPVEISEHAKKLLKLLENHEGWQKSYNEVSTPQLNTRILYKDIGTMHNYVRNCIIIDNQLVADIFTSKEKKMIYKAAQIMHGKLSFMENREKELQVKNKLDEWLKKT